MTVQEHSLRHVAVRECEVVPVVELEVRRDLGLFVDDRAVQLPVRPHDSELLVVARSSLFLKRELTGRQAVCRHYEPRDASALAVSSRVRSPRNWNKFARRYCCSVVITTAMAIMVEHEVFRREPLAPVRVVREMLLRVRLKRSYKAGVGHSPTRAL